MWDDRWSIQIIQRTSASYLDLRLHRLTGLEQDKIYKYNDLLDTIADLLDILGSQNVCSKLFVMS